MDKIFKFLFWIFWILLMILIAAKLGDIINYSWWWIFSPIWIGWSLLIVLIILNIIKKNYGK